MLSSRVPHQNWLGWSNFCFQQSPQDGTLEDVDDRVQKFFAKSAIITDFVLSKKLFGSEREHLAHTTNRHKGANYLSKIYPLLMSSTSLRVPAYYCEYSLWFSLAQSVRSRTMNLCNRLYCQLVVLIVHIRVWPGAECAKSTYSMRVRIAQARVGSFTKIRTSSKIIRIYLVGKAIKISLKWGVNQLSRVRNEEVTAI